MVMLNTLLKIIVKRKVSNICSASRRLCLSERSNRLLLRKYNHPQSNGKIEKWFDTYEKHRYRYDSINEFIDWYNEIKPHFSLDLRTPEEMFWKRVRSYIIGNFFGKAEKGDKI